MKKLFDEPVIIEGVFSDKKFARWTKYGKDRIYINREDGKKTYGYIDLLHDNKLVCSSDLVCGLTPYVEKFFEDYLVPGQE